MFRLRMVSFLLAVVLALALSGTQPRAAQAKIPETRLLQGPVVPSGPYAKYCVGGYPGYIQETCYSWWLIASMIDPSVYDKITFVVVFDICQTVWVGNGYQRMCHSFYASDVHWDFGDGTSPVVSTGVSHQYSVDGKYTVKAHLPSMTLYGTALNEFTLERPITVETHDTAITDFKVHKNMHTGQARKMSVNVISSRYDETVEVQLFKRYPGEDWMLVTSLTQAVPVVTPKDAVTFDFVYEVPSQDASAGEVVFKAVAVNVGEKEARPTDNEMLSEPVEVKK